MTTERRTSPSRHSACDRSTIGYIMGVTETELLERAWDEVAWRRASHDRRSAPGAYRYRPNTSHTWAWRIQYPSGPVPRLTPQARSALSRPHCDLSAKHS